MVNIASLAKIESCDFLRHEVLALRERVRQLEHTEEVLQQSIQDLADVKFALDQSSIIAITDRQGVITEVNDKFCEISQYSREELIGRTHRLINSGYHPPEFFEQMWRTISSGKVWRGELKNRAKSGSFYWVDTTIVPFLDRRGRPYQYVAVRNDITARKQAEESLFHLNEQLEAKVESRTADLTRTLRELQQAQIHLVQSEKMSGLGQLVAGVAHEINNPVNFIYGNLSHADEYIQDLMQLIQLYQNYYPIPHPEIDRVLNLIDLEFLMEDLPHLLQSMRVGAERIQKIVASLRVFSRMDEAEMKAVNIHEGIDSTLMILQSRLKAKSDRGEIVLVKEYGKLPMVECYAGQLNQVFMNVLSNAIDALEETSLRQPNHSSCITISTYLSEQNQAVIKIADNGIGISHGMQQHLFDPFFTTKPIGKGTGLGLSISYQIVTERHGGSLNCESEPGKGCTFIITIPITQKA